MAATSRVEMAANDGSHYVHVSSNGHRGHVTSRLGLERPGFLRDIYEGRTPILGGAGAGGSTVPGATASTRVELPPLSQILSLETIPSVEQKIVRQVELRRATNAALGLCTDDPSIGSVQPKSMESFGFEELKRVKASISDNASRARERSRHLSEAILKLDRFCHILQSRKRLRSEKPVHERRLMSLASESPSSVPSLGKVNLSGTLGYSVPADAMGRPGDKGKAVNVNKKLRTGAMDIKADPDGRPNQSSTARSVSFSDRGRPNEYLSSTIDDQVRLALSPSKLWEKSKLKGRRSGVKQDVSVATGQAGPSEGEREQKWSGQHRLSHDSRARLNDSHGLRSGPVHGITSIHKAEATLQANELPKPIGKVDTDNIAFIVDKLERPLTTDKERPLLKTSAKASNQEEFHSVSPTTVTKVKAARAPRSNSVVTGNCAHLARVASFGDRERSSTTLSKLQVTPGQSNRKNLAPSRSSSPPVAQWVGQRPQKIARSARRVNLMLPIDPPPSDDVAYGECEGNIKRDGATIPRSNSGTFSSGSLFARTSSVCGLAFPKLRKPRSERVNSSLIISESEESEGTTDGKLKDKLKKHGDWDTKLPLAVQKIGDAVAFSPKKLQVEAREDVRDGVWRQGRSGRTPLVSKQLHEQSPFEEVDASVIGKQSRSVKIGIGKPERIGRATLKNRTLDRKPSTRTRRPPGNSVGELSGDSDDDRDDLINAAELAKSASALACSSDFWKKVEPFFSYLTVDDMRFLRSQVDLTCTTSLDSPGLEASGKPFPYANGSEHGKNSLSTNNSENLHTPGESSVTVLLEKVFPLSQRLLAALINEARPQENCRFEETGNDNCVKPQRDHFMPSNLVKNTNTHATNPNLDDVNGVNHKGESCYGDVRSQSAMGKSTGVQGFQDSFVVDSYDETVDILVQVKSGSPNRTNKDAVDSHHNSILGIESVARKNGNSSINGSAISRQGLMAWGLQYEAMSLDERILLELQSIGITVEQVPDLAQKEEDIGIEMSKLKKKLSTQVCLNKRRIQALEHTIVTRKDAEERDREKLALMKLVEIAYNKRKGFRGGVSSNMGNKSNGTKGTRAAAMAFAKRTLTRVRKFKEGQSCFIDVALRSILFPNTSRQSEGAEVTQGAKKRQDSTTPALKDIAASRIKLEDGGTSIVSEGTGMLVSPISDLKDRLAVKFEHSLPGISSATCSKGKDVVNLHGVSSLVNTAFGGTKGKRSERDKSQGKEMLMKDRLDGRACHATGNLKGERKTKTKPRQKTGPLFKEINGLGIPAELPKGCSSLGHDHVEQIRDKKNEVQVDTQQSSMAGGIDLSQLQIPEDLGVPDALGTAHDLGSWFDFEDANLQDGQGDLLMGLDVPMDDLSDLGMMM